MTSLLARLPSLGPGRSTERRGPAAPVLAVATTLAVTLTGLLGLGLALVVVQTLDPDGGLPVGSSARLAGQLWLLGQGGELVLPSGPLRLAPLLLTAGIAWGLSRAAGSVVAVRELGDPGPVGRVLAVVVAVHTALTAALALLVRTPGADVGWLRTMLGALVLALVAGGLGALRDSGLSAEVADRFPGPGRVLVRAAVAGTLALAACCTAVVAVALADDVDGVGRLVTGLGGASAGAAGQVGLSVLLLPNAAAAVVGLAAGPGFLVGAGTLVSVGGVTLGSVPALPLMAALPDTQAVPLLAFLSQALPALAGLVAGLVVGRRLGDADGGALTAALWGLVGGVGVGVLSGALVWVAGGRLGDGGLAEIGAPALATGLAVAAQAGLVAAPVAAVTRWRNRG
ncbi:cell division protein PerM [Modestobacter versicolor]|uniref:cell division protein PerM n=1 Tax=Modestobacter versicolor TaxID=429133 RepID=UPI0034DF65EE